MAVPTIITGLIVKMLRPERVIKAVRTLLFVQQMAAQRQVVMDLSFTMNQSPLSILPYNKPSTTISLAAALSTTTVQVYYVKLKIIT